MSFANETFTMHEDKFLKYKVFQFKFKSLNRIVKTIQFILFLIKHVLWTITYKNNIIIYSMRK